MTRKKKSSLKQLEAEVSKLIKKLSKPHIEIDYARMVKSKADLNEEVTQLKQRISYLEDCLRDAGYKCCTDECGEFWVKESK